MKSNSKNKKKMSLIYSDKVIKLRLWRLWFSLKYLIYIEVKTCLVNKQKKRFIILYFKHMSVGPAGPRVVPQPPAGCLHATSSQIEAQIRRVPKTFFSITYHLLNIWSITYCYALCDIQINFFAIVIMKQCQCVI